MDFKVKCLESASLFFKKGETYNVVNGKLIDDFGNERPSDPQDKIESVDGINYRNKLPYSWIGKFELAEEELSKGEDKMSDIIEIKLNINGNKFGSYDDAILCIQQMKQQEEDNMKRIKNEREDKLKKEKNKRIDEIKTAHNKLRELKEKFQKDYNEEVFHTSIGKELSKLIDSLEAPTQYGMRIR